MQYLYDARMVESLIEDALADITDRDIAASESESMTDEEVSAYTDGLRYAAGVLKSKLVKFRHVQAVHVPQN
jgi:hypothetical protein